MQEACLWHAPQAQELLLSAWDVDGAEHGNSLHPTNCQGISGGTRAWTQDLTHRGSNMQGVPHFQVSPLRSGQPETPEASWPDGQPKWTCEYAQVGVAIWAHF